MRGISRGATLGGAAAAVVTIFGACRGEVTAAGDSDADSTLHTQVMRAQADTGGVMRALERTDAERAADGALAAPLVPAPTLPERKADPPPLPRPSANIALGNSPPQRRSETREPARERPSVEPPAAVPTSSRAPVEAPAPSRATIPAGTELSFAATQRICVNTNEVGDRFTARLMRSVRSSRGALIPGGARATAVVSSLTGPLGEEAIDIEVRSIAVGGETHRIAARVTDIELDRRPGAYRCIPEGGRISVTLTRQVEIPI